MTPTKCIDNNNDCDYGYFCDLDVNNNILPMKQQNYILVMKKIYQTNSEYYLKNYHEQHKQMYGEPNSIEYDINTADYYYDYEYCGIKTIHTPNYKREFTNIILDKYAGTINTFVTVLTITTSGLLLYMLFI
jgi:ribonucleotide reductase alpha subunit